jgi:hypothetical protein
MNKDEALLKVARDHLQWEGDDLESPNVQFIVRALKAAYEAGAEAANPEQAPYKPLSTLIYIEDTNDTLEIFPVLRGQIEVRMREQASPVGNVLLIDECRKADVDWLYERCRTWRMATFRMLCDQLK